MIVRLKWLIAWGVYLIGGRDYSYLDEEWHCRWDWQTRWMTKE